MENNDSHVKNQILTVRFFNLCPQLFSLSSRSLPNFFWVKKKKKANEILHLYLESQNHNSGMSGEEDNCRQPLLVVLQEDTSTTNDEQITKHPYEDDQIRKSSPVETVSWLSIWIETKKLWHLVGPSIFQRIAMASMNVVTQAFAGHLGDVELASVTIANTVICGFAFGFLVCTCPYY